MPLRKKSLFLRSSLIKYIYLRLHLQIECPLLLSHLLVKLSFSFSLRIDQVLNLFVCRIFHLLDILIFNLSLSIKCISLLVDLLLGCDS